MRGFFDRRTRSSAGITAAPICPTQQHVLNSWLGVRGFEFARSQISFPLHRCLVGTIRLAPDHSWMSWIAGESVRAIPQHYLVSLVIEIDHLGCLCDVGGRCGDCMRNLPCLGLLFWRYRLCLSDDCFCG